MRNTIIIEKLRAMVIIIIFILMFCMNNNYFLINYIPIYYLYLFIYLMFFINILI